MADQEKPPHEHDTPPPSETRRPEAHPEPLGHLASKRQAKRARERREDKATREAERAAPHQKVIPASTWAAYRAALRGSGAAEGAATGNTRPQPITVGAALAEHARRVEGGTGIDPATGTPTAKAAKPDMHRVSANLRNAIRWVRGFTGKRRVDQVNLTPHATKLVKAAHRQAVASGAPHPAKAARDVALVLANVLGGNHIPALRALNPNRYVRGADEVPGPWREMYDALVSRAADSEYRREQPRELIRVAQICAAHGAHGPTDMPSDPDLFREWAIGTGCSPRTVNRLIVTYRFARALVGDGHLPSLYRPLPRVRGVRSLPDVAERAAAAGLGDDINGVDTIDLMRLYAPRMSAEVEAYLTDLEDRRSAYWHFRVTGVVDGYIAALVRRDLDPSDLSLLDLVMPPEGAEADPRAAGLLPPTVAPCLLEILLGDIGVDSVALSPITLRGSDPTVSKPAHVTAAVKQMVHCTRPIITHLFERTLVRSNPALWTAICSELDAITAHVSRSNKGLRLVGHKAKHLVPVTYPELLCLGLPALRAEIRRLEEVYAEAVAAADPAEVDLQWHLPRTRRLDEARRTYVLLALLIDDGLRIANYAEAIAGVHIVPDVIRDATGQWVGFAGASSHFRGHDDAAKLKVATDSIGAEIRRDRRISPSIMDMNILYGYWRDSRPRDLVRRGALQDVTDFDPDHDAYAVIISPRIGGRRHTGNRVRDPRAQQTGQYSTAGLSAVVGKALIHIAADVLGREVPAWTDPARTREYRAIFAAHVTRIMIATYWGGLRGDWGHAEWLTLSREQTLRHDYSRVSDTLRMRMHTPGIEHPNHFDTFMDRVRHYRDGDDWAGVWDAFDPACPEQALDLLTPPLTGPATGREAPPAAPPPSTGPRRPRRRRV